MKGHNSEVRPPMSRKVVSGGTTVRRPLEPRLHPKAGSKKKAK